MKVLLVEDSATLRHAMCQQIQAAGHETLVAESGEQALQLVETTPVDLVIMDVEMPGLNGFETTRLMRESFGDHWVPIIFITGMSDEASFHEGIEAGGDDYLIKPVTPIILRAKIRALERIADMRDQLRRLNEELKALSQRDGLTGLYNRRTFEEKAQERWQLLCRNQQPASILMIDVDHFKAYNDCHGHLAGDRCLKEVAESLAQVIRRPADLLARYGGEEFVVLLPQTDVEGARVVAETLRRGVRALALPNRGIGTNSTVTISIGGATTLHSSGTNPEALLQQADKALYRSKNEGRDRATIVEVHGYRTVLVVDRDPASLDLICGELRQYCNILTAHTGDECLEIAHNIHPDLVFLDLATAGEDGDRICEDLKTSPLTAAIPLVLLAAEGEEDLAKLGTTLNADACLQKPLMPTELLATVDKLL